MVGHDVLQNVVVKQQAKLVHRHNESKMSGSLTFWLKAGCSLRPTLSPLLCLHAVCLTACLAFAFDFKLCRAARGCVILAFALDTLLMHVEEPAH